MLAPWPIGDKRTCRNDLCNNAGSTLGGWSAGWSIWGTIGQSWDARIALDPLSGDVFASDGKEIFRLDAENRALSNVGAAPDFDRDGVPDARDAFPSNLSEYLDTDGDGIGNQVDSDSDGDGVEDSMDGAPFDRYEVMDSDGDGVGDGADLDDDGDGVLDVFDDYPLDEQEYADTDGDQIGDRLDADDDGDGANDLADAFRAIFANGSIPTGTVSATTWIATMTTTASPTMPIPIRLTVPKNRVFSGPPTTHNCGRL